MSKAKSARKPREMALGAQLASWFERQKRVLPWRDEPTPYRVWISEIMLQQTQVVTVIPYFEKFVGRFPSVEVLAQAAEEDVLKYWAGLGYYSRARNIHRAARMIVESGWPRDREGWLEMPGVGEYTAGAICSIAFDQPEAILDGNVERVLSRVLRIDRSGGDAAYKKRLWDEAREGVERAHALKVKPSVFNQALMELGATVCMPKNPRCPICPVADSCQARAKGQIDLYPPKKKPKEWLDVREELHCFLDADGRVLLRRRAGGEWRAGLWDLVEEKHSLPRGANAKPLRLGKIETKYVVTRHKVTRVTHVWKLKPLGGAQKPGWKAVWKAAESEGETRWCSMAEPEVAVGSPLRRTLQLVRERFFSEGSAPQMGLFKS